MGEISAQQPVMAFHKEGSGYGEDITIGLTIGEVASFSGEFVDNTIEGRQVFMGNLRTDPDHRQKGHATRLVSALTYLAIAAEMPLIRTSVESQHTVAIFAKLYGEDITFYDMDPITKREVILPMTTTQAIQSLEHAEEFEDDLEDRQICFSMRVGLSNRDATVFERPDITQLQETVAQAAILRLCIDQS